MNDLISRTAVLRLLDENCVVFRGEIEKMPGVDAIPVEWLEKQSNTYDLFIASALKETLKAWKIEQEHING